MVETVDIVYMKVAEKSFMDDFLNLGHFLISEESWTATTHLGTHLHFTFAVG